MSETAEAYRTKREERAFRQSTLVDIKNEPAACARAINRLMVAGATSRRIDVLKSMHAKLPSYGSLTPKQHSFAASIIETELLDQLVALYLKDREPEPAVSEAAIEQAEAPRPIGPMTPTITMRHPNFGLFA